MDYQATAKKLIWSARRRAPHPLFLDFVFKEELESLTDSKEDRKAIRAAAREYLNKEDR